MNEILIYTDIGEDYWNDGSSVSARGVKSQLDAMGSGDLVVRINSPGGSVFDGFAIYNLIAQREGKTTVYIDGMAASAASVVAMAGDDIIMADNSLLMIHDPYTVTVGGSGDMRDTADLLDKIKGSIVSTYQTKSSLDADELSQMMAAETWFSAKEAIQHGFATGTMDGGQTVTNISKPWIKNGPKPEQLSEDVQTQTAWRLALSKRRMSLLD